jgi:hypothetical protein
MATVMHPEISPASASAVQRNADGTPPPKMPNSKPSAMSGDKITGVMPNARPSHERQSKIVNHSHPQYECRDARQQEHLDSDVEYATRDGERNHYGLRTFECFL